MSQPAQNGDQVTLIYQGKLTSGELFESSADTGPITFVIGEGSVLPAFEAAVLGMKPGETKTIQVKPENGFGEHNPELIESFPRSTFKTGGALIPGMVVGITTEIEGVKQQVPATITTVEGDNVIVDFNHPLAGKDLLYQITLESISQTDGQGACGCSTDSGCDCGHC